MNSVAMLINSVLKFSLAVCWSVCIITHLDEVIIWGYCYCYCWWGGTESLGIY
jgi:hypothetical protein